MGDQTRQRKVVTTKVDDREARVLARYLVGDVGDPDHRLRYSEAVEKLSLGESRVLRLALRHPVLLGVLDGGCGVVRPNDPLRQRLLVMAAILEATPDHVDAFLPTPRPMVFLLLHCLYNGLVGLLKAVVGAPIVLLVGSGK